MAYSGRFPLLSDAKNGYEQSDVEIELTDDERIELFAAAKTHVDAGYWPPNLMWERCQWQRALARDPNA